MKVSEHKLMTKENYNNTTLEQDATLIYESIINDLIRENQELEENRLHLETSLSELEKKSKYKDKILATIAHDLRGPVQSFMSVLAMPDGFLDEQEFNFIKKQCHEQLLPFNDMLETIFKWATSSFKTGAQVERKLISLREVVNNNLDVLQPSLATKNIVIQNRVSPAAMVIANSCQMSVVLRNLICNAIKFTPSGGKIILRSDLRNKHVSLSIADKGVGMNADQQSKLFTPQQSSSFGTAGEKGTGLGLFLCKEYVEENGGEIFVSSKEGEGSTFKIILPAVY